MQNRLCTSYEGYECGVHGREGGREWERIGGKAMWSTWEEGGSETESEEREERKGRKKGKREGRKEEEERVSVTLNVRMIVALDV